MTSQRILITSALPYANGPLHVGHAIGAYIPADIYARFNRMKGNDVLYICGTDEYGTPISVKADAEGITPQEVVDRYHEIISKAFSDLGISFDNFSRTTSKTHYDFSRKFFLNILEKDQIYKKIVNRPYCPSCKRFLPDRYVRGVCPTCGSADERGDQCEACGKQLEPHELKDAYCSICGNPPEMRETEHWFFKLGDYDTLLRKWIEKNRHWPDNARNFSLGWLKEGLEDRAITRDLSWGVPVPIEGAEGKVLYVWFDAPIGYISATKEWSEKEGKLDEWKKYWEGDTKIVHFIGKDNIPFHAIIWPAMLMAHGGYNLPWQISSNEYLNLEGRKMSTSRGWVLWLHDCLAEFEPDLLRYYLLSINPEKKDSDFALKDFKDKVNNELIATFGNFIHRSMTFIEKKGSVVPEITEYDELDERMQDVIREAPEKVGAHIEKFKFLEALKELMHIASLGNEYFQKKEPWKNENATTLYLCANLCRTLAILSTPFIPCSAEKVWKMLNLKGSVYEQTWDSAGELGIPEGHMIQKVHALYEKLEDDRIAAFERKYLKAKVKEQARKGAPVKEAAVKEEKAGTIEFDEFGRVDLRTGVIKEAREHPKADKLYILKVDVGEEKDRQIVAGIRNSYKIEELIGRQVAVVANLKPAKLRGELSEGMLLAADVDGKAILLTPEKTVAAGSKVR